MLDLIVRIFTSLKLTVICLAFSMVLVFMGTMAQVDLGMHAAQEKYFQSVWVYGVLPGTSWKLPYFPGGHLIGGVLFINLIAAHLYRFKMSWKKSGILLVHLGIFLLLLGGILTEVLSVESQMRIHEGDTKNYSESISRVELIVVDVSNPDFDEVVSIPDRILSSGKSIQHPSLPFRVNVVKFFPNSHIHARDENNSATESLNSPIITQGFGGKFTVNEVPPTTRINEMDVPAAVVEVVPVEGSLGTWLCSTAFDELQSFSYQNKTYQLQLRSTRYYKPYSIKLLDFSHDQYDGTDIPKNFSSKIRLIHSAKKEDREVLIYMNNPLRYEGETFYQSGFEKDNTTTVLQVIRNPSWVTPYLACTLVALGLVIQFSMHLVQFGKRKSS